MELFWKAVNLHVMQAYWRKWTPRGRPWGFTAWLYSQSTLCFLPVAAVWPVTPYSWCYAFPAIMDSALQLWDPLSIPSLTPSGFFARCVTTAMTAIKITSTDARELISDFEVHGQRSEETELLSPVVFCLQPSMLTPCKDCIFVSFGCNVCSVPAPNPSLRGSKRKF